MKLFSLGVDIGGSHITCQLINLQNLQPVPESYIRISIDPKASKNNIISGWSKAIQNAIVKQSVTSVAGIGFAMPGPFDYRNGIALFDENVGKFQQLYGVDVKAEIINKLNLPTGFPVRFLNDAACFAIGETWIGIAANYRRVIALTLGTGFGTTFVEDGLPVSGKYGIPEDGFLYHVPFKQSIADEYFSTRWFTSEWEKLTETKIENVKELAHLADQNPGALKMFHRFGSNLGDFLVPWVNAFNADCIVIGGNIAKSSDLFLPEMTKCFADAGIHPEICISTLGENAALMGSARLYDDDYYGKLLKSGIYK